MIAQNILQDILQNKISAYDRSFYLQQLLVSMIPVVIVLLIGAYCSQQMRSENTILFTGVILLAAIVTFTGIQLVLNLMQNETNKRYKEITTACREFLAGNMTIKATVRGKNELSNLTEAINQLMDHQRQLQQRINSSPPPKPPPSTSQSKGNGEKLLLQQLMKIVNDLTPVANGDLRVRTSVSGTNRLIRAITDTYNSLIEELAQFVRWTRYASQVVVTTSQNLLGSSIELTKNTENQMHHLSQTTKNVEEIVAFMQHLSNTLHLSSDISRELQQTIQERLQDDRKSNAPLIQLLNETQRQAELLEHVLASTEETSTLAESLINDLYTVAQQIYQSSVSALKTVERLSELAAMAERWHEATGALKIEEDGEKNEIKEPWLL
jgi:methyl-accepting chemotaxis protein